jgi:hypothetical protein
MVSQWIIDAMNAERERQRSKFYGNHGWGIGDCSSPGVSKIVKAAVLSEEVGEIARAVLDRDDENLKTELIQVMAVAAAWLETFTKE